MIAKKHSGVRHCHDFSQDLDAVGMPIYHIAEDIQRIFRLKVDLVQDGMKSSYVAVDVG